MVVGHVSENQQYDTHNLWIWIISLVSSLRWLLKILPLRWLVAVGVIITR